MAVIDPRLELARQQGAFQSSGRVTTLGQALAPAQRVAPTNQGSYDQMQLEALASSRFNDTHRRLEAMRIANGEQADAGGWAGLIQDVTNFAPIKYGILKPLEVLDTPRRAIISAAREAIDTFDSDPNTKGSFGDWWNQTTDVSYGFGKAFPNPTGNKWLDRGIGLVGDVLLDPLTYVTTGANLAVRNGTYAAGRAGRLAAAGRALRITGNAEIAKIIASQNIGAARKLMTAEQVVEFGLKESGLYMFGKHLPAVRIPLTGKLNTGVEQAFTRMRIAATMSKPGGWLQKMTIGKWLPEEKLGLLRGTVPTDQVERKLLAVLSEDAKRAATGEAERLVSRLVRSAAQDSNVIQDQELRSTLYRYLDSPTDAVLAGMTPQQASAAKVWQDAFNQLHEVMDGELRRIDPATNFGKVARYLPHQSSQEAFAWMSAGSPEAKAVTELLGRDSFSPETFFQPRKLKIGNKWFGVELKTADDLRIERLNQIGREEGKLAFDFFETDIGDIARTYAKQWSSQMGNIGATANLVDRGLIPKIAQELAVDESQLGDVVAKLTRVVKDHDAAFTSGTKSVRQAAKAMAEFFDSVDAGLNDMLNATRKNLGAAQAARFGRSEKSGLLLRAAKDALTASSDELNSLKGALRREFSELEDVTFQDLLDSELQQADDALASAKAMLSEAEQFADASVDDLARLAQRKGEVARAMNAAIVKADAVRNRGQLILEYQDWFALHSDDIMNGRLEDVPEFGAVPKEFADMTPEQAKAAGRAPRINSAAAKEARRAGRVREAAGFPTNQDLAKDFSPSAYTERGRQTVEGQLAASKGSLSEWLVSAKDLDPNVAELLKRVPKRILDSTKNADVLNYFNAAASGQGGMQAAQASSALVIARTLKWWGGVANIPSSFRPLYDAALEKARVLTDLAEYEDLLRNSGRESWDDFAARAETSGIQVWDKSSARADRYGVAARELEADFHEYQGLVYRRYALKQAKQKYLKSFGLKESTNDIVYRIGDDPSLRKIFADRQVTRRVEDVSTRYVFPKGGKQDYAALYESGTKRLKELEDRWAVAERGSNDEELVAAFDALADHKRQLEEFINKYAKRDSQGRPQQIETVSTRDVTEQIDVSKELIASELLAVEKRMDELSERTYQTVSRNPGRVSEEVNTELSALVEQSDAYAGRREEVARLVADRPASRGGRRAAIDARLEKIRSMGGIADETVKMLERAKARYPRWFAERDARLATASVADARSQLKLVNDKLAAARAAGADPWGIEMEMEALGTDLDKLLGKTSSPDLSPLLIREGSAIGKLSSYNDLSQRAKSLGEDLKLAELLRNDLVKKVESAPAEVLADGNPITAATEAKESLTLGDLLTSKGVDAEINRMKRLSYRNATASDKTLVGRSEAQGNSFRVGTNTGAQERVVVAAQTAAQDRAEAMLVMEQFLIVGEAARRYGMMTRSLSKFGFTPSDRMMSDVLNIVRAERQQTAMAGQAFAADSMLGWLRGARDNANLGLLSPGKETREAYTKLIKDMFGSAGSDADGRLRAEMVLGSVDDWTGKIDDVLNRIDDLEQRRAALPVGSSEREALKKQIDAIYKNEAAPWYRDRNPLATAKLRRSAVNKELAFVSTGSVDTFEKARKKLDDIERLLLQRSEAGSKFSDVYRQLGDPDYNATEALEQSGRFVYQTTPMVEVTMLEAARVELERRLLAVTAIEENTKTFATKQVAPAEAAAGAAAAAHEKARAAIQPAMDKIDAKINELQTNALMPGAMRDETMYKFLASMAHVEGHLVEATTWKALGFDGNIANARELEQFWTEYSRLRSLGNDYKVVARRSEPSIRAAGAPSWKPMAGSGKLRISADRSTVPIHSVEEVMPGDILEIISAEGASPQNFLQATKRQPTLGITPTDGRLTFEVKSTGSSFTAEEWRSLWSGPDAKRVDAAMKEIARAEQRVAYVQRNLEAAQVAARKTDIMTGNEILQASRSEYNQVLLGARKLKAKAVADAAAFSDETYASARAKLNGIYEQGRARWGDNWMESADARRLAAATSSGAEETVDQATVVSRKELLKARWEASPEAKLREQFYKLQAVRGVELDKLSPTLGTVEATQRSLGEVQLKLADRLHRSALVQSRLRTSVDEIGRMRLGITSPVDPATDLAGLTDWSGLVQTELMQKLEAQRPLVGTTLEPPLATMPFKADAAFKKQVRSTESEALKQVAKYDKAAEKLTALQSDILAEETNAKLAMFDALERETQALTDALSLESSRQLRRAELDGKITATKASEAAAKERLAAAQRKFDQVAAMSDNETAALTREHAALDAQAELESIFRSPRTLLRDAGNVKVDTVGLEKKISLGEKARKRLASGKIKGRNGRPRDLTDAERIKLSTVIDAADVAKTELDASRLTPAELIGLSRALNDLYLFAAPSSMRETTDLRLELQALRDELEKGVQDVAKKRQIRFLENRINSERFGEFQDSLIASLKSESVSTGTVYERKLRVEALQTQINEMRATVGTRAQRSRLFYLESRIKELTSVGPVLNEAIDAQSTRFNAMRALMISSSVAEADMIRGASRSAAAREALQRLESGIYPDELMKVVPQIKEGWVTLESWGLPSYQAQPELVEMFTNVSRLQVPAVAAEMSKFLSGYTRFFKAWAVATPGFHVRNALSNTFSVFSAGADLVNMTRATSMYESWLNSVGKGIKTESAWIAALSETDRPTFMLARSMMDAAGNGMAVTALDDLAATGKRELFTNNKWLKMNRTFGERVEGSARFMLAYDSAVKGMDLNTGAARVKRFLFDYSDKTVLDETVGTIIPFWTWMSRNLPLQVVNRWSNPRSYLMYNKFMASIRENDDNEMVPSWLREQGAISLGGGLYLNPDMPQSRIGEQLSMLGDPKRLLSMVNPALRLPIELAGGKQLYNDVPFSSKPQQVTGGPLSALLTPLLALAGQTETVGPAGVADKSGRMIMQPGETSTNATANYAFQNAIPFLSLSERLMPNTDQYDQRQGQSWLNFLGVPLRQVTPGMRDSEFERRKQQINAMAVAAQRLGYGP